MRKRVFLLLIIVLFYFLQSTVALCNETSQNVYLTASTLTSKNNNSIENEVITNNTTSPINFHKVLKFIDFQVEQTIEMKVRVMEFSANNKSYNFNYNNIIPSYITVDNTSYAKQIYFSICLNLKI
jgi:hypothetical protein